MYSLQITQPVESFWRTVLYKTHDESYKDLVNVTSQTLATPVLKRFDWMIESKQMVISDFEPSDWLKNASRNAIMVQLVTLVY